MLVCSVNAECIKNDGYKCLAFKHSSLSVLESNDYRLTLKVKSDASGDILYSWMLFTPYTWRLQLTSRFEKVFYGDGQLGTTYRLNFLCDF